MCNKFIVITIYLTSLI